MRTYKQIRDIIYNNPRADKQSTDPSEVKADKEIKDKMLYDEKVSDVIKRMLGAYKKRKREKKIDKLKSNQDHWKGLE